MTNTPSAAAPTEEQLLAAIGQFRASGARRATSAEIYRRLMPAQAAAVVPGEVDPYFATVVNMLRKLTNEGRIQTLPDDDGLTLTVRFPFDPTS